MPWLSTKTCPRPHSIDASKDNSSSSPQTYPRTLYPLYKNTNVEFGLELLPEGSGIPWHHHATQEEILFVYQGHMKVVLDAGHSDDGTRMEERVLGPGEGVHIPVGVRHHALTWTKQVDPGAADGSVWLTWTLFGAGEAPNLVEQI